MTVTKEMVQAFLDFIKEDTWAYCGEEGKQYYHIDGLVNVEAALEAAFAAVPGPSVKVKPLEWKDAPVPPSGECLASSVVGLYCIPHGSGIFHLRFRDSIALGDFSTLDAAKAAAQADYEARIMAAIEPAPDLASENERLRAALTPSGNTKAAYIGEFSFTIEDRDEDGEEWPREITVPWATVKVIMKAIREYAALERT